MTQNSNSSLQDITPNFNPDSPYLIGLAKLLTAAYFDVDLGPIGNALIQHLQTAPDDHKAMMDLSSILYIRGNDTVAAATQLEAIKMQQLYHLPTAVDKPVRLRLLALMVTGDFMANTPLEFMLTGSNIALDVLYVKPYGELPAELPQHDVLFVAVGESDMTRDLLEDLCEAVEGWRSPLLNHPRPSLDLSRDRVADLLQDNLAVSIPLTARVDRYDLSEIQSGAALSDFLPDGVFPLIIRPIGSHAGKGLEKLQAATDIPAYLQAHDGDEFFISCFVDYRSADGLFRKYRIVLIEGRPFLCHMAISQHWMVHYLNANMSGENSAKRDEEAITMLSFDVDFAARHEAAFEVLTRTFPLDYFGIDCAETKDGRLLIFEVDTGMIVHAMDPVDMFPYKQENMHNVFTAFRDMLYKARDSSAPSPLPSVSTLLLQGGDERIKLLDGKASNKYGCSPYPVAGYVDFGSSTASNVSAQTFGLLELQRCRLADAIAASTIEQVYAQELQHLRVQFLSLWGLQPDRVRMIFSASGTDAHLIAARLAEALYSAPLAIIMVQCEESGSGVAAALCGERFLSHTATGDVSPVLISSSGLTTAITYIDLRIANGSARARVDVDADFENAADRVLQQGLPAMIVGVDASKTGIIAPGLATLTRLKKRWGAQLTILIDACQLRTDAPTLQAYLQLGCMVAVTGSKFFSAPSFCGALLVPEEQAHQLQERQIPVLLKSCSGSAEWPPNWLDTGDLVSVPNLGLLLRWNAAVHEMRNFLEIPAHEVRRIVSLFQIEIQRRLTEDPYFQPLDDHAAESRNPATIHSFFLRRPALNRKELLPNDVERVYRDLQSMAQADGRTYRVGQPVQCGFAGKTPLLALRLCLSAPMIATAYYAGDAGMAELISQAMDCLSAVTATVERL